eukprot:scaffold120282_cov31-Tisochrysis_lutea.AAC.2
MSIARLVDLPYLAGTQCSVSIAAEPVVVQQRRRRGHVRGENGEAGDLGPTHEAGSLRIVHCIVAH